MIEFWVLTIAIFILINFLVYKLYKQLYQHQRTIAEKPLNKNFQEFGGIAIKYWYVIHIVSSLITFALISSLNILPS